jgi:hypothetical protein
MTMQPLHTPLAFHPVPARRHYDAHQAAEAVGLSRDRFRKVRLAWTRDRDFPAEINEPGEPIRYLADAVDRWVQRRTQRVHQLAEAKAPPPAPPQSGQKGRAALRSIKGRG